MQKKLLVLILMLFASYSVAGERIHKQDVFKRHYEKSLFKVTKAGNYSVEMMIQNRMFNVGVNAADIIIHDRNDKEIVGADITFTPWMPEMGHGIFTAPGITERGGGVYEIEDVTLVMSGHWEMRIEIDQDNVKDTVVFDFPDVQAASSHGHKNEHKMVVTKAPSDLDLSKSGLSSNNIFKVSYISNHEPMPINRIHSWTLKVQTTDGKPLKGAKISIDGDMPEHGHGMPTKPEVTEEIRPGEYLVEGMKFSMPGWWVIDFNVRTADKQDNIKFNVILN